jgi:hypothetical protein
MTVNKVQGTGFAQIANNALRDKRLSFKARGVLAMVLSYSGEWDSPRDWLEQQSDKDGRDAIQSALNELTDLGYRTVVKKQKADGTWTTEAHWFHTPEEPTEGRVSRPSEKPSVGEPVPPPEHHLQNTKSGAALPPLPTMEGRTETFASRAAVKSPRAKGVATPMPKDFQPSPAMVAWTKEHCPDIDAKREWTSFVNHHEAKGSRFVKWDAAWRTWANNAQKWAEQRSKVDAKKGKAPRDMSAAWIKQDFGDPFAGLA